MIFLIITTGVILIGAIMMTAIQAKRRREENVKSSTISTARTFFITGLIAFIFAVIILGAVSTNYEKKLDYVDETRESYKTAMRYNDVSRAYMYQNLGNAMIDQLKLDYETFNFWIFLMPDEIENLEEI